MLLPHPQIFTEIPDFHPESTTPVLKTCFWSFSHSAVIWKKKILDFFYSTVDKFLYNLHH